MPGSYDDLAVGIAKPENAGLVVGGVQSSDDIAFRHVHHEDSVAVGYGQPASLREEHNVSSA